jgi:glucose-6-phosphate isomerase
MARAFEGKAPLEIFFFDNTDPAGFELTLKKIGDLKDLLCIVISKSGSTPETVNGQIAAENYLKKAGLDFSASAVAVTQSGSKLDKLAVAKNWLARFPMWDWVGGRTSIWSAVGLLPLALLGVDIRKLLNGAAAADRLGRLEVDQNPAMLLALYWLKETAGRGEKNMVILPYSDRLELFGKYLQQLIMESLGKEHDLSGKVVNQGITVFGNKGSTDQHSYVQQLRSGLNDFFAIFINTLSTEGDFSVTPEETAFDYLNGFFLGTRKALNDNCRTSLTVTLGKIDEHTVAALIAIFERAVSIYAIFTKINAYDQPGVEAGKKAAANFLSLQKKIIEVASSLTAPETAEVFADKFKEFDTADILQLLMHIESSGSLSSDQNKNIIERKFWKIKS